ncbi:hypothetical protein F5Y08DRAFT_329846 [Xylaria arbuscula]|nr:hypothetical protein F5Y08DRAFT_329846 [Xylaria arbuscula]
MPLLRLPNETLTQIFDQVGSSFFREDLGRLTVCKYWFEFALPACLKCITLSQETLRSLIASGIMERLSPLKNSVETLDIELRGYQVCISKYYPQEHTLGSNALMATASNETARDNPVKTWMKVLNNDLAKLAIIAQQCRRLRTLYIRAWRSLSPEPLDMPDDYLLLPTMQSLLSAENLSVLVLDLSVDLLKSPGKQEKDNHICPTIGALLCSLRTLHVRMRSICPDVLKPWNHKDRLHLREVVINLSLTSNLAGITSAAHSKRCGSREGGLLQLRDDMLVQADVLATRMSSPKIMRILTHSLPQFEKHSLDVLTGKTMILDDDMGWDEDGKTIKDDSDPESELLDDEFSSFSDE